MQYPINEMFQTLQGEGDYWRAGRTIRHAELRQTAGDSAAL